MAIYGPSLVTLAGLEGLTEVTGEFTIRSAHLQNVDPLSQLERVLYFQIGFPDGGGPYIAQIEGLSGLLEVGVLDIRATSGLSSLAGLENLEAIDLISINDNPHIVDVTPIGGGKPLTVSGVSIGDNPSLPSCNAWALIDALNVVDGASVTGNLADACGD